MGFADFPIEVFKAFKVKSAENTKVVEKLPLVSRSDNLQSRPDSPVAILPNMLDSCRIPDRTNSVNQNSAKSNEIPDRIEKKVESVGISHSQELLESQKVKGHHDHHRLNSPFVGLLHRNATPNGQGEPAPKNRVQGGSVIDVSSKSLHRSLSGNSQAGQISLDAALGAGKGIGRIVGAGLKSPMDFTLSLARGFHNAPKLYGDESVRHADKITGIQSGLKAAGKVRHKLRSP